MLRSQRVNCQSAGEGQPRILLFIAVAVCSDVHRICPPMDKLSLSEFGECQIPLPDE